jgi:mannose-6-phosphate isomerase-like protein (cupin superfamily)
MQVSPNRIVDSPLSTTERLMNDVGFDPKAPKASVFTLESPLPEQGNDRAYLAHTDKLWLFLTVHAPANGENLMHTHNNEDHSFVVLQGSAEFNGPNGEVAKVAKHQGIMLPRGVFYTFRALNDEPLVMLRIGAVVDPEKNPHGRIDMNGKELQGNASDNNAVATVFKAGAFFR